MNFLLKSVSSISKFKLIAIKCCVLASFTTVYADNDLDSIQFPGSGDVADLSSGGVIVTATVSGSATTYTSVVIENMVGSVSGAWSVGTGSDFVTAAKAANEDILFTIRGLKA